MDADEGHHRHQHARSAPIRRLQQLRHQVCLGIETRTAALPSGEFRVSPSLYACRHLCLSLSVVCVYARARARVCICIAFCVLVSAHLSVLLSVLPPPPSKTTTATTNKQLCELICVLSGVKVLYVRYV